MKIIINADDFGASEDTVNATIECFENGSLTSATLMSKMPSTHLAIDYAKANSHFSFGAHLTFVRESDLTEESPIMSAHGLPSLTTKDGYFRSSQHVRLASLFNLVNSNEIEAEIEAQLSYLVDHGVQISHVDSHGHLHKFAAFKAALASVLPRFSIRRVRSVQDLYLTLPWASPTFWLGGLWRKAISTSFVTTDHLFMIGNGDSPERWPKQLLECYVPGNSLEIGVHPGYLEGWRNSERIGINNFANIVKSYGHQIISWSDL
jgi:predicted glycoside hydrolase/deacetylase ChbG (UPF0249 family)